MADRNLRENNNFRDNDLNKMTHDEANLNRANHEESEKIDRSVKQANQNRDKHD